MKIYILLVPVFLFCFSESSHAENADIELYRKCSLVDECIVGLNQCGDVIGINKNYSEEAKVWAKNTPWSCPLLERHKPTHIMCINHRCEVINSENSFNVKEISDEDIPETFTPYTKIDRTQLLQLLKEINRGKE